MEEEFLTTEEAAAALGVSVRRVQQFIGDGRLRARRFGSSKRAPYLITRADVEVLEKMERRQGARTDLEAAKPATKGKPGPGSKGSSRKR